MYTFIDITYRMNNNWYFDTTGSMTIQTIVDSYSDGFINVSRVVSGNTVLEQLNLNEMVNLRNFTNQTIANYINTTDDSVTTLSPVTTLIRDFNNKAAIRYSNIWDYGLQADRCTLVTSVGNPSAPRPVQGKDLKLTKVNTVNSISSVNTNTLFMVNGLVKAHSLYNDAIYIPNVIRELDSSFGKQVSLLDFSAVGGYTKTDISAADVTLYRSTPDSTTVHIKVPTIPPKSTLIAVVNGLIHILDGTYSTLDENTVTLTIDHGELIKTLVGYIGSEIPWINNANLVNKGWDLNSINIPLCLDGPNSFFIIVDKQLAKSVDVLSDTGITDRYTYHKYPEGILTLGTGRVVDYIVSRDNKYDLVISTSSVPAAVTYGDTIGIDDSTFTLASNMESSSRRFISTYYDLLPFTR